MSNYMTLAYCVFQVHGIIRRSSSFNTGRISHLYADTRTHKMGGMHAYCTVMYLQLKPVSWFSESAKPTRLQSTGKASKPKVCQIPLQTSCCMKSCRLHLSRLISSDCWLTGYFIFYKISDQYNFCQSLKLYITVTAKGTYLRILYCQLYHSQDLISNSPQCLPYNSYDVSLNNLVLD